jgi:thiol-disulfide isomerase/thioredoxin
MRTYKSLRLALVGLICAGAVIVHASDALKIGDPAPMLKADRWLKGTPVPKFEKGKIYVLEFWATWCGPCRVAMPHLSKLAKKFEGKATFVGVNIWEDQHSKPDQNLDAVVDKFMKENGGDMDYNVCAGTKDGYMAKNWMNAAGQGGIPATFVIDGDSKIAWIGHPVYLEEPLSKIIDGTFDVKAFAAEFNKQREAASAQQKIMDEAMRPIKEAVAAKKFGEAVIAADQAIAKYPAYTMVFAISKFEAIMADSPEKAYAEAVKVRADWDQSYIFGSFFLQRDGLDKKYYQFALDLFLEQNKQKPEVASRLTLIARAYSRLGEHVQALDYQTRYVEAVKKMGAGDVVIRELEKELQKFKEAAGKG